MRHEVEIVGIEPSPGEYDGVVHFRIAANEYEADALGIEDFRGVIGRTLEVELHANVDGPRWDDDFRANDARERRIVRTGASTYEAFGIVRSIEPITVDCGDLVLSMGKWTHDERVVRRGHQSASLASRHLATRGEYQRQPLKALHRLPLRASWRAPTLWGRRAVPESADLRRAHRLEPAHGCRQRRPGNRLKSRSVVTHSQPDSIASAAR